jgi:hypothetical protein
MADTYPELRFPETRVPGRRYFYYNGSFGALDAVALAAIARHYAPKRVIEVGSGHSSAALLDLRDDGILTGCAFTFIDPDFSRVRELMSETDLGGVTMLAKKVQDVSLDVFRQLGPGDILLIDSSHVAKIGSDVNFIVFHILPVLAPGVIVHFHDVFDRFEYPREWYVEGRYWNEQYLLRAFLMYNTAFEILLFSSYLFNRFNAVFREKMPAVLATGGGQLWLRRRHDHDVGRAWER